MLPFNLASYRHLHLPMARGVAFVGVHLSDDANGSQEVVEVVCPLIQHQRSL